MKLTIFKCAMLLIALSAVNVLHAADSIHFTHKITVEKNVTPGYGRDFWLAIPQIPDEGNGIGTYFMLYVASQKPCTVNIELKGQPIVSLQCGLKAVAYSIPRAYELVTSGQIENKSVHVWSDQSDLSVYWISRNPKSSDGSYVIPTIGWGRDHVVASYHSLYELSFDYPSEFAIVSHKDQTSVHIIPTQDIRKSGQPNQVLHPKGAQFDEVLGKGQSVQYQLTQAQNADEWDITGTLVTSNNNIGLIGASQCPNIPPSNTYCDHINDMIPPIRTWGQTYYSAPIRGRKGGDTFLFIASKPGQTIYKDDKTAPGRIECVLNQYEPFFDPGIDIATKWYSDAPFLLAQYCNSTDWPTSGANNGIGDPCMVVLTPEEQFTKSLIIQTPTIQSGQGTFQNVVNVIYSTIAAQHTFFDGVKIDAAPGSTLVPLPGNRYAILRIVGAGQGRHTITSDSGVGAYMYGFGDYDMYAWSGAIGNRTIESNDSTPITASITDADIEEVVRLNDLGNNASGISSIVADSMVNMVLMTDTAFYIGEGMPNTSYTISPFDPFSDAHAVISVYDMAGNRTIVNSHFSALSVVAGKLALDTIDFGSVLLHDTVSARAATVTNTGGSALLLDSVWLDDPSHFNLIGYSLPIFIAEGKSVKFLVTMSREDTGTFESTINVRAKGGTTAVGLVRGHVSGGAGSLIIFEKLVVFDTVARNAPRPMRDVTVRKTGSGPVTIATLQSSSDRFEFDPQDAVNRLRVDIPEGQSHVFHLYLKTDQGGLHQSTITVTASDGSFATTTARGLVLGASSVTQPNANDLDAWLNNVSSGNSIVAAPSPNPASSVIGFDYALKHGSDVSLSIYDLLGKEIVVIAKAKHQERGVYHVSQEISKLIPGSYRYIFTAGDESKTGQILIR